MKQSAEYNNICISVFQVLGYCFRSKYDIQAMDNKAVSFVLLHVPTQATTPLTVVNCIYVALLKLKMLSRPPLLDRLDTKGEHYLKRLNKSGRALIGIFHHLLK